jgi:RNA polymerase sigma factor (sigma-70 family)
VAGPDTPLSLLDRLRNHDDAEAWRQFALLYEPLLRRWVGRNVSQPAAIDDIVQEVLSVLLEGLPKFEHNLGPGAFRAWLKSITIHRIRRHWRTEHLTAGQISEIEDLEDPNSNLSRVWDQEHDRHLLGVLLDRIRPEFDPRTWAVFQRVVFDGASPRDVARESEISANAVYIAKARVLKRLRLEGRGLID